MNLKTFFQKETSFYDIVVALYRLLICNGLLLLNGVIVASLYLLSMGKLRRINAEVICKYFSRTILKLIGVNLIIDKEISIYRENAIFLFNHNSLLDIFLISALGIPNTRFVLSTRTIILLPISLCAFGCGTLYIPFKNRPHKRLKFFKKTAKFLQHNSVNLLCSPEGVHSFKHGVHKFNKGVFHMATVAKRDLYSIYFDIPKETNPLETYFFKRGIVTASLIGKVETKDWQISDLDERIDFVRQRYVVEFEKCNRSIQA